MKSEAEHIAVLADRICDCRLKMLESVSKRAGISAAEAEFILRLFDGVEAEPRLLPNTLIENGLISTDGDGEAVLTGKGAILAKSMSTSRAKFTEALLSGITPEQRFVLSDILEKVFANAENINNN